MVELKKTTDQGSPENVMANNPRAKLETTQVSLLAQMVKNMPEMWETQV